MDSCEGVDEFGWGSSDFGVIMHYDAVVLFIIPHYGYINFWPSNP